MGYLLENFIVEALNEKVVAAYVSEFREAHFMVVETVCRNPENLRTIMGAVVDRNEKLAQFLLECLWVVSKREETAKGVLNVFVKTHADRVVARRICELEFETTEINGRLHVKSTLRPNRSKFTFCMLQIIGRLLNKRQPVAIVNFTRETLAHGDPDPDKLIGNLMLLVCQNTLLNFKIEAMNIISLVLEIVRSSSLKQASSESLPQETGICDAAAFDLRCVKLIQKMSLNRCHYYFHLLDLFVQTRAAGILTLLFSQTDLAKAVSQASKAGRVNKHAFAIAAGVLRVIKDSRYRDNFDIKGNLENIKQLILQVGGRAFRPDNMISAAIENLCRELQNPLATRNCGNNCSPEVFQ